MSGMEYLCKACGMKFLGIANTYGVSYLIRDKPELLKERRKDLEEHAKKILEMSEKA